MSKGKDLKDIKIRELPEQFMQLFSKFYRYRIMVFVLFVGTVYGFLSFQIINYSNPPTNTSTVDTQVTILTPRIDESVINQLLSLKDNSVNVNALFKEARKNPFAE